MSGTFRNASYICMACTCNHISGGGVCSKLRPIVGRFAVMQHTKIKNLHLSMSVSEVSEKEGTEAMDTPRSHNEEEHYCM